ncbi:polysaccharide deacetylase family protein [Psychrobacillus sp. NEAU-3TGS]|uniref:polysaccharide deacetylase family protein n=1 Tax=Psychrobacillus sp. NEAU-3TGS TaxID=2995412 RepID=UPI00249777B9|nr:polysaccharide deacetylase family protein [Psychrobacillus sp. NEAU-3TGS]MDI2586522.1 polysaccharide deacetylase family protein [Psychrobacillus sp. NEAU-3TGS]
MELNWGVHDAFTLQNYGENILGARIAIPRILQLFLKYDIHATWAIVGMLYCKSKEELLSKLEDLEVPYENEAFSPKSNLWQVGENEIQDPYHYGHSLIDTIKSLPNQEIGTHTFSHYYCLEAGQRTEHFETDLQAIVQLNEEITSLVFPRNQTNNDYLYVCKKYGINAYRGNEKTWIYSPYTSKTNTRTKRMLRLLDAYVNLTGHHTFPLKSIQKEPIINIKSSRFLRPYSKQLAVLEKLRLRRIKNGLTKAAKNNELYHLWWHPHNFGKNIEENLQFLEEILKHVDYLKANYNFQSMHMRDVIDVLKIIS